jgi:hypothetical protein
MRNRRSQLLRALALAAVFCSVSAPAFAQELRLEGRVPESARVEVDAILDSARAHGLPTEPLVDRALEGASKGAPGDLIVAAVRRLAGDLSSALDAFGPESSDPEIVAGASALRAGAEPEDLENLRSLRADQSLTIAAAVLADLVAVGIPADTAAVAVIALAVGADDVEYIAFRRNVERDIALGASPVAALGVRLNAAADALEVAGAATAAPGARRRPRKP